MNYHAFDTLSTKINITKSIHSKSTQNQTHSNLRDCSFLIKATNISKSPHMGGRRIDDLSQRLRLRLRLRHPGESRSSSRRVRSHEISSRNRYIIIAIIIEPNGGTTCGIHIHNSVVTKVECVTNCVLMY